MKHIEIRILGTILLLVITSFLVYTQDLFSQSAEGWFARGSHPDDYEMGGNPAASHGSESAGYIKSKVSEPEGFGTLMKRIEPDKYFGKRLRLSAYVRTEKVDGWAGLWMRIDGPEDTTLSFDNMQNRQIKGTTDWKKYEIVLDVPDNSTRISYGVLLDKGQAWFNGLELSTVTREVPVTDINIKFTYFKQGRYKVAASLFYKDAKEANPGYIYDHLFYFLSLYRNGQIKKAQDYILELSNTFKEEKWIAPVVHFYAGKMTGDALLSIAEDKDPKKDKEQKCEAYYYIGMMHLLKDHGTKAKHYFEKCVSTDVKYFSEYELAKVELDRLK